MNVYFVYKVLTNRIRALIIAAGYIGRGNNHVMLSCLFDVPSPVPRLKHVHVHSANAMAHPANCVKRVLSIQSHVVHGYSGNTAATFPLQVS